MNIPSLDIFIKNMAAKSISQLKEFIELKHDLFGNGALMSVSDSLTLVQRIRREYSKN